MIYRYYKNGWSIGRLASFFGYCDRKVRNVVIDYDNDGRVLKYWSSEFKYYNEEKKNKENGK